MVADRPDWLISRQRAWGVPITLMVNKDGTLHTEREDADAIDARILAAVRKDGVDGWFDTQPIGRKSRIFSMSGLILAVPTRFV